MSVKLGAVVEDRVTPLPAEFWIVPPDPAKPVPVTVRPPEVPVLDRLIPGLAPLDETAWKFSPPVPIVVPDTLTAVAVVVVAVLPDPVAVTVPPPVAENAVFPPVLRVSVPPKLIVAPVLPLSEIPVWLSLMFPPMVSVPPVRPATDTECPVLPVTLAPAKSRLPVPPLT